MAKTKYKMNYSGSFTERVKDKDGKVLKEANHKFSKGDIIELEVSPGELGEKVTQKKVTKESEEKKESEETQE